MNNKKLLNAFKLKSKLTLFVPATKGTEHIDNSPYVDDTAKLLSECFGGATSTPALGYWLSARDGLIKENTTLVFSYCKDSCSPHTRG